MDKKILEKIKPGAKVRVYSIVSARTQVSSEEKKGKKKEKGTSLPAEGTSIFEGLVLSRKHGNEAGATFTVRSVMAGVGVEKIFPINSPSISKVEVLSSPKKVHRAKLYFVRKMSAARTRQKLGVSV